MSRFDGGIQVALEVDGRVLSREVTAAAAFALDTSAFLQAMLDYVDEGPTSLDDVLASIDAAWP